MNKLRFLPLWILALCFPVSAILTASPAVAQKVVPTARLVNSIDETQLVTLKGTVHPLANARNDRGAAPDDLQLDRLHLVLKRSDSQEASLRQLISDMHTPGTASYHQWLTPDQFGAQFGPSDQDIATVTSWLSSHGFNVTKVLPGKQAVEFSGNAAQMRTAFHTQIHQYSINGQTHYANTTDPQIPAALAPVVGGFASLNNFRIKSQSHYLGSATYDPKTDKATPQWTIGPGTPAENDNFVLAPADFAVQYDLGPLYTAGVTGTGQTIAIINDSNVNMDLVNQFRSIFLPGYPANPPQVIIDGNDPGVDGINNPDGANGDSSEAYIDVEWSGAVAPSATIDLVVAADTALENGLYLAMEHAVYSNVAPVMSLSFGACEASVGSYNAYFNQLWEEAAAQGITVMVSTGDSGSAGCDRGTDYAVGGQTVSGFASTPYNVAVGGTDFYYSSYNQGTPAINTQLATYWNTTASNTTPAASIKGVIPEQPWNDSQFGLNLFSTYVDSSGTATNIAGGSGGSSAIYTTKPSWQTGFGDSVRDLPDVSLFAANGANDSYYPVCANDGDCQTPSSGNIMQISGYGGTSVSSPAFAGIMALVNQKYGPQGQADYVLYPLFKQYPAAFHDVTVGTNSVPCEYSPTKSPSCIAAPSGLGYTITDPSYGTAVEGEIGNTTTLVPDYNAGIGYDEASGLGTVDANVMVGDWNKITFAKSTTTLTPSLTSFTHGTSITVGGAVTGSGTPTGNVALMTNSLEENQQGQGLAPVLNGFDYLAGGAFGTSTFPLSGGVFSGSVSTLPGGTYKIWGSYSGDGVNALSTSTPVQITVAPEASGVFLQAVTPSGTISGGQTISGAIDYGTQFELSAQIAPSSQLSTFETCTTTCPVFTLPTGTVIFKDTNSGSGLPETAVVNAEGDAEFNAPFSVGSHTLTAVYSGDSSYNTSTSPAITFTVGQDTPAILIGGANQTSATNVFQFLGGTGQPTVLNVIVENYAQYNSGSGVSVAPPTGTVTATGTLPSGMNSSTTLVAGVDPSDSAQAGIGTFTIPASASTGSYNITFTYNGDTNYAQIGGLATVQIVGQSGLTSTTTATMSGSISPNSTITITGSVTGQSGHPAPTGGVGLFASGNYGNLYSITPGSGDVSTFSFTVDSRSLFQGANFVTIQYIGDATYNWSAVTLGNGTPISNPLSDFTLVPNTTNVPVIAGSNGTDTINLASVNGFSGTVALTCKATGVTCSIANQGLSAGGSATATLTINASSFTANQSYDVLVTGSDPTGQFVHTLAITAVVTGSSAGSTSFALSNSGNLTVNPGVNTNNTSIITVTPEGTFTGNVALTCAVAPTTGTSVPTCAFSTTPVDITGTTALTSTLTVATTGTTTTGVYTVTVTGTSGAITPTTVVTVNVGTPGFTLANSGPATIATTGSSGTANITVTPTNGFTGTVSLSCVTTSTPTSPNDPATCSVTTQPPAITGSAAVTGTVTINTTAATALNKPMQLFWPSTGGAVLAFALFFGIPKRRRNWLMMIGLLVLFVSGAAIGCGGGGSSSGGGGGGTSNPGTTTGAYTFTVTATSGSISQTTVVTVNVN
jgi:hypothetical protein